MEEKPNYYAIIPANVRYDNDLKPNEKLMFGEITALSNKNGYCTATNAYFAKLYNVTNVTISQWINNLVQKGYVLSEIIYKEGTKQILNRYLKIFEYPIKENFNTPIKENFKDNNINKNNTSLNNILYIGQVIDYLNEKTGSNYRASSKANQRHIQARLNEGYTIDDFKKVIDNKCASWQGTEYEQYLRPETLFGAKFESYLNEKPKLKKESFYEILARL